MSLFHSYFSISERRRWLYATMALLLAAAQLLSQLHSLKHLDEHDGGSHSELNCNICILSADLESSNPAASASPATDYPSGIEAVPVSSFPRLISPNYGFDPRAPPVSLQLS